MSLLGTPCDTFCRKFLRFDCGFCGRNRLSGLGDECVCCLYEGKKGEYMGFPVFCPLAFSFLLYPLVSGRYAGGVRNADPGSLCFCTGTGIRLSVQKKQIHFAGRRYPFLVGFFFHPVYRIGERIGSYLQISYNQAL